MQENPILKKKVTSAFIWDFVGIFAGKGTTFLVSIVLARLLTPYDFGLVAMVMVFVGLSQILYDAGFTSAIVQAQVVSKIQYSTIFYVNFAISSLLTFLLYIFSGTIAQFYKEPSIESLAKAVSFSFVLTALNSVQTARLRRNLDFKTITKSQIISALLSGTITVYLAYSGFGVWSLVMQVLLLSTFNLIATWYLTKWLPFGKIDLKSISNMWRFGKNIFLSSILESIYQRIDYLIIGKLFSTNSLGYYYRGKSLQNIISALSSSSLMKVLLPTIGKIQDDKDRVKRLFHLLSEVLLFLSFFLIGLLYVNAEAIFFILFGKQWTESVPIFKVLIIAIWPISLKALILNIINGLGKSSDFLKAEIKIKIINFSPFILAYYFGLFYMLWAFVAIGVFSIIIPMRILLNEIKIEAKKEVYIIIKNILIFIIVIVITNFLQIQLNSVVLKLTYLSSVYTIFYFAFHYVFNKNIFKIILSLVRTGK